MTYDSARKSDGYISATIVEIDLDYCTLTHSTSPCTASAPTGQECFNTRSSCQDAANYNAGTKTYRFSDSKLPIGANTIPCITSVQFDGIEMDAGRSIGKRGVVNISLSDFRSNDVGADKYYSTRTYTPIETGTFFGKLLARNPFFRGRALRVKTGFWDGTSYDSANFKTRHYVIENITPPNASGRVSITAKDPLKLAEDQRAKAPAISSVELGAALNSTDTSCTVSNTDLPSGGGTIAIDKEIITYTSRSGTTVSGMTRGAHGSTAASHGDGSKVQLCLTYSSERIEEVVKDLLLNYANIPSGYINSTDWDTEYDDHQSGHTLTTVIPKPEGVTKLINEICELTNTSLWWDDEDQEIKYKAFSPVTDATDSDINDRHILSDSLSVSVKDAERYNEVWIYYAPINFAESMTNADNFSKVSVAVDANRQSSDQDNDSRVKTMYSRWHDANENVEVDDVATKFVLEYRDAPNLITFQLDASYAAAKVGDSVTVQTEQIQSVTGEPEVLKATVIAIRNIQSASRFEYKLRKFSFQGKFGCWGPDAGVTSSHSSATTEEKEKYMYWSDDTGEVQAGVPGYLWG